MPVTFVLRESVVDALVLNGVDMTFGALNPSRAAGLDQGRLWPLAIVNAPGGVRQEGSVVVPGGVRVLLVTCRKRTGRQNRQEH